MGTGIEAYANETQSVKDIIMHKEGLAWFELRLSVEHFHLQETMVGLVQENFSPDDIQHLVSDPSGELWKATDVQASLQRWVRGGRDLGVILFLQIMERLHRTLREVTARFAKVSEWGVRIRHFSQDTMFDKHLLNRIWQFSTSLEVTG